MQIIMYFKSSAKQMTNKPFPENYSTHNIDINFLNSVFICANCRIQYFEWFIFFLAPFREQLKSQTTHLNGFYLS